jgi:outer membrane immunogenic protein
MRHLIGITAAVALGGSAMAADMAVKAPGPVGYGNWTSCYIGGNVAGGWSRNESSGVLSAATGISTITIDGGGLLYGGQVGCDYQFSGPWVVGVQGMLDNGPIVGNNSFAFPFTALGGGQQAYPFSGETHIPWVVTATARLGYATDPQTMLFVRGGAAFVKDEPTISVFGASPQPIPVFFATDNRTGWTIGGGLEHKWWPNISGTIEYSYMDFGTKSVAFTNLAGAPVGSLSFKSQVQTFMLGLNYRFGGFGPVVTKY